MNVNEFGAQYSIITYEQHASLIDELERISSLLTKSFKIYWFTKIDEVELQ